MDRVYCDTSERRPLFGHTYHYDLDRRIIRIETVFLTEPTRWVRETEARIRAETLVHDLNHPPPMFEPI